MLGLLFVKKIFATDALKVTLTVFFFSWAKSTAKVKPENLSIKDFDLRLKPLNLGGCFSGSFSDGVKVPVLNLLGYC